VDAHDEEGEHSGGDAEEDLLVCWRRVMFWRAVLGDAVFGGKKRLTFSFWICGYGMRLGVRLWHVRWLSVVVLAESHFSRRMSRDSEQVLSSERH
jgi:hypothetical protein